MNEVRKLKKNVVIFNFSPLDFLLCKIKEQEFQRIFICFSLPITLFFINLCLDLDNNLIVV